MVNQARLAAACLAWELSRRAKGYSFARLAQRHCRSFLLVPRVSIHSRSALFLMNWTTRMASSMPAYCACVPSDLRMVGEGIAPPTATKAPDMRLSPHPGSEVDGHL